MKGRTFNGIALASALSILALFVLQYNWMAKSRKLIEEQFNERVNLALCNTVQKMSKNEECSTIVASCSLLSPDNCSNRLQELLQTESFNLSLQESLEFYQVNIPYEVRILSPDPLQKWLLPPGCCNLKPLVNNADHYLGLVFPGRRQYIFKKMGMMLFSSFLILLLTCLLLVLINLALIRQKRITEANKDFFNHMAHEFRTPLANISLASNLLVKKRTELNDDKFLKIMNKESEHLMKHVNQILDFAKMEKGEFAFHTEKLDLHTLLKELMDDFELLIMARQAKVNLNIPSEPLWIEGNAFHLKNVFKNLMDNALKHHPGNPVIDILVEKRPAGIHLSFADDGLGICEADKSNIFRKFYQSAHKTAKGFGLGLAYVKKIIEMHRGSIALAPIVEKGARFELFFPNASL